MGFKHEEVGDLFVTDRLMTVKLLPSKRSASKSIRWFEGGEVIDHQCAAKDIASIVNRISGKSRVVRGLTLMTDRGCSQDLSETGLHEAVKKAGFTPIN